MPGTWKKKVSKSVEKLVKHTILVQTGNSVGKYSTSYSCISGFLGIFEVSALFVSCYHILDCKLLCDIYCYV